MFWVFWGLFVCFFLQIVYVYNFNVIDIVLKEREKRYCYGINKTFSALDSEYSLQEEQEWVNYCGMVWFMITYRKRYLEMTDGFLIGFCKLNAAREECLT